jgi:biotin carboxyl carrier protein
MFCQMAKFYSSSNCKVAAGSGSSHVIVGDKNAKISEQLPGASADLAQQALCPNAPMPGLVRQILVKVGDKVQPGQPLVVMEAMKLQMTLSAGGAGKITAVLVQEGELVSEDAQLLQMVASDA